MEAANTSIGEDGMLVSRIMRKPVTTITPDTPVRVAAALMGQLCIGALPVCLDDRPIGIVTDRDIAVRWVPRFMSDCPVALIMTPNVVTCYANETIENAAYMMSDAQIRRIVVLEQSGGISGIVSLGDIAVDANENLAGQTMGEVIEER